MADYVIPESSGGWRDLAVTRRNFLRSAAGVGLSLPAAGTLLTACGGETSSPGSSGTNNTGTITFVSYGGSYNDNLQAAMIDPFETATGHTVNLGANTGLAQLKLQVESGNVQWDIAELNGSEYEVAVRQNLLESYDYDAIDVSNVPDYAVKEFGVKYALFLFTMAWDQRQIVDAIAPQNWEEFWDTGQFTGKRSLYERVDDGSILEAALMAEGVPLDEIYPLDIERALRGLERLGRENFTWHPTPQDGIQQLLTGEVPLASSWNGRVGIAQREQDAEIGFTPNRSVVSGDYLVVPKGAPNPELAFELINFILTDAEAGADYSQKTFYAIANTAALELLPPEFAAQLPTNPALQGEILTKDDAWWADNLEEATGRFKEWQLSGG
jgi:putative spermidine/putrescine transport system substrate-binding protein